MGYDIHITRQDNWFDDNMSRKISLEEWTSFISSDTEMRLDNYAEATTTAGEFIRVESEGLSVWTKFSGDGLNGNHVWFDYNQGNITVKNADNEIITKMLAIADRLNAKVQGDEGEVYECSADGQILHKHISDNDNQVDKPKPW